MLVLQGGGALGAYQAGVYQALHEAGIEPDWVIGTSIGAINASLIAGNAPENRLPRLQEFWQRMEHNPVWSFRALAGLHEMLSYWSTVTNGIPASSSRIRWPFPANYPLGADQRRLLLDRAAGADAARAGRLQSGQSMHAAADRRRRACAHQPDALFRQPRRRLGVKHSWPRARCRRRFRPCASTASSIGTAAFFEHADRSGVRRQSAQELADLRRAHVESGRRRAEDDLGGAEPAEGHPVFEPGRQPHRAPAADAPAAPCHQRACRAVPDDGAKRGGARVAGYGCLTRMHVVRLLAPRLEARTTPRTSTSAVRHPQRWEAGYLHTGRARSTPWAGEFDPLEGVILHEQTEVMPQAAE